MLKRLLTLALVLALVCVPVLAAQESSEDPPVRIHTVSELLSMGAYGSYILMEDLDLSGVTWHCPAFSGTFDGNGHTIYNLTLTRPSDTRDVSYDGNQNKYDTDFYGFFGSLYDAQVRDLNLVNVRACIQTDTHAFIGALAGNSRRSTIEGCTVTASLELRADTKMFGVGGLIGYGSGTVRDCDVDVTLVCTDLNKKHMDEQFLGGVFATGFMTVEDCRVKIDGYSSDYGYVHNGGITGMYLQYPIAEGKEGRITGNHISGKITFFECNPDRRAYCRAEAGEILAFWYTVEGNTIDFFRDERWEYDKELRPHMCGSEDFTEKLHAPSCDSCGWSVFRCDSCGWEYRDRYTLPRHRVTVWTEVQPATETAEGLLEGFCDGCSLRFTQGIPMLPPAPTTVPATEPTVPPTTVPPTEPPAVADPDRDISPLPIFAGMGIITVALVSFLILRPRKGGKYAK